MVTVPAWVEFEEQFGAAPDLLVRSPGRVNLIGDHTDYNDGLVLPMAIDRSMIVGIRRTDSSSVEAYSSHYDQTVRVLIDQVAKEPITDWSRYLVGVIAMLRRQNIPVPGAQLWIGGDLRLGAGLASSAALEVGVAQALLAISDRTLPPVTLATMCRAAEQEFAGAPCGIMDQLCCTSATVNHALLLDCRSMIVEHIPLALGTATFVVLDSGVRHEIAESEYVTRRRECAAALDAARESDPSIRTLRDVTLDSLPRLEVSFDDTMKRRVRHVVSENARVTEAAYALGEGNLVSLGWLMADSHASLRDDFEVSCDELDTLVTAAEGIEGVYGARMTGGGFGGCVVALVETDSVEALTATVQGLDCDRFDVFPVRSAGAAAPIRGS